MVSLSSNGRATITVICIALAVAAFFIDEIHGYAAILKANREANSQQPTPQTTTTTTTTTTKTTPTAVPTTGGPRPGHLLPSAARGTEPWYRNPKLPCPAFKLEPRMKAHEQALLEKALSDARKRADAERRPMRYVEWGSGGSSALAAVYAHESHAIETFKQWCQTVTEQEAVRCRTARHQMFFHCVEPVGAGGIGSWGAPVVKAAHLPGWHQYVNEIDQTNGDAPWRPFDVIFVDGRFRVACAIKALAYCTRETGKRSSNGDAIREPIPSCHMLMHDYINRPQYHAIERNGWELVASNGTMAMFAPRPTITDEHLSRYLMWMDTSV